MKYNIKGNYFNGNYQQAILSGPGRVEHFIKKYSPADIDNLLWEMPVDYSHVPLSIESAQSGFHFWKKVNINERIKLLKKYQEQLLVKQKQIATAIALETGKPLWESRGEVNASINKVDITIDYALKRIKSKHIAEVMPKIDGHIFFKPIGICLIIGPFNFLCHLANTQILSALIAGNSIIFKPSEKTAYSAQLMTDCFHEAGFPKGIVNLVQGDAETAGRLLKEKNVKGIFFTGSKEIGTSIIKNTYHDLSKLVSLELGGKNTAIIHKDANLEHALSEVVTGSFLTTGQRCTSTAIVAIHKSIAEKFIQNFHNVSKRIIIDHPIDHEKEPFLGPIIDEKALESYLLFVGMAKREGFQEIMRGKKITHTKYNGHYVTPSIHFSDKLITKSHFLQNEIFGPNCTFITYQEIEEAIQIANYTEYGLAASLFSSDRSLFEKCSYDIDSGIVNFNNATCGASPLLPFGGIKNSGNYRPMAIAAIDSCVYQMASLEKLSCDNSLKNIKGLMSEP